MSTIEEIRKRVEGWAERRSSRVSVAEFEAEADQAQQDRATLLAALDGEWQSERPTQGLWWLSLHPDHRNKVEDWPEVVPVYVDSAGGCFSVGVYVAGNDYILTGALWQRRTVPGDPFAKGGGK